MLPELTTSFNSTTPDSHSLLNVILLSTYYIEKTMKMSIGMVIQRRDTQDGVIGQPISLMESI